MNVILFTDIVIGWEHETFRVDESGGQAHICFMVLEGNSFNLVQNVPVNITTRDGTASRGGGGSQQDYIPDPIPRRFDFSRLLAGDFFCTNIPIVDDPIFDSAVNETFFVDLSIDDVIDRVSISSSTVVVNIIDNEGKH